MTGWVRSLMLLVGLVVFYLLVKPVPIDPAPWRPAPNAGFTGPFARNESLTAADSILTGQGPEALALGPDGWLYTGLEDGRVVRIHPERGTVEPFSQTDGRPLGLAFNATGELLVADGERGILAIVPNGNVRLLTQGVGGEPFGLADALDVAADGTIWFSDASRRIASAGDALTDFWEARPSGRLLRYTPADGRTTVVMDSLDFANGVALGPADAYVLVAETLMGRVHRLWLTGPRAGEREVFIEGLPGVPDNITYDDERGIFWIGLFAPRTALAERVRALPPFLRKVVYRIPESLRGSPVAAYGMVIGVDTTGAVRINLQDPTGRLWSTTGALRMGDQLFVSTLQRDLIGRLPLP